MASSPSWRGIWFWYRRQMAGLLPSAWRAGRVVRSNALVVDLDDIANSLTLSRRDRGVERRLRAGQLSTILALLADESSKAPVVLRLPVDRLLTRDVVLPLAAEMDVRGALALNFDTLTPFSPDEAFWSFEVTNRHATQNLLHVRLLLLPKVDVAEIVARLNPVAAEFVGAGERTRVLPLRAAEAERQSSRRLLWPASAGLVAGILLALLVQPVAAVMLRSRAVEAEIAALQPSLARAEALRRSLEAGTAGQDLILRERKRTGDIVAVLALLTDALPDDASLTELVINQRHLALSGEASGAARLLLALSDSASLTGVAFSAPVTHAASGGKDVFAIQAQVK